MSEQYRINQVVEFLGWEDESGLAKLKLQDGSEMKVTAEIFLSLYTKVEENE